MQRMLIRIVLYLVVFVVALCAIVLAYLATQIEFAEALSFVVVLLVASIPMAIEIVTTTTLALGSKGMYKKTLPSLWLNMAGIHVSATLMPYRLHRVESPRCDCCTTGGNRRHGRHGNSLLRQDRNADA